MIKCVALIITVSFVNFGPMRNEIVQFYMDDKLAEQHKRGKEKRTLLRSSSSCLWLASFH